jgi:hypothetical protein
MMSWTISVVTMKAWRMWKKKRRWLSIVADNSRMLLILKSLSKNLKYNTRLLGSREKIRRSLMKGVRS